MKSDYTKKFLGKKLILTQVQKMKVFTVRAATGRAERKFLMKIRNIRAVMILA